MSVERTDHLNRIYGMDRDIERHILLLRGYRVILDADLAAIYGVSTKRLNEQVKRNLRRFPADFFFQLTPKEKAEVVANCDHLHALKFAPYLPQAFTEHGAVMLAAVLKSRVAVTASIQIVRAFNRMRRIIAAHADLAAKIAELESKYDSHDAQIQELFTAIRRFLDSPPDPPREIGFKPE